MREREKQIREKLRWRDKHLEDQIKKRENTLIAADSFRPSRCSESTKFIS